MYVTFLSRFKEVNTRYLAPNSSLLKGNQYIQKTINLKSLFHYSHRILLFNLRNSKRIIKSPHGAVEDTFCSSFSLGITATRFWVTVLLSVPFPVETPLLYCAETARRTCFSANLLQTT